MNKSALKNFATSARKELLKKVEAKAMKIGITEVNIKKTDIESSDSIFIDGKQLSKEEKIQRDKLIARINQIGFKQVIEEVAYTWFNRFTALRYMEVNEYLPTDVRVLSSTNADSVEPDMMKEALSLELEIDKEYVYDLKLNNETEELFKYLIIKHCNDLNRSLPFMFETIDYYTEMLFPEGLLVKDSFIRKMTDSEVISENDWEEVEIIGWMYQYYNNELNELVYDGNMSKSRIAKELLPAATQLFTPDWAVKYMVENSLGRLWLDGHPNENLQKSWEYYLENAEEPYDKSIKLQYSQINPEEIKILDPCMGSGHILVYAFDVLMDIYKSCGYIPRDASKLILQKNLYGLEIEDRAYQLACFSVVMKARKYNRRIFDEKIELNLCSIIESNEISDKDIQGAINLEAEDIETANYLISVFKNAKEYGSILNIEEKDYESLYRSLINNTHEVRDLFQGQLLSEAIEVLPKLIKQARIMTQKYEIVTTNPPYLGNSRMSPFLDDYVKEHFPSTKSDLSMVMYQKSINSYLKQGGILSFITTTSWMYLKSFENFRKNLIETIEFSSMVDFGTELFDGKVGHNPIVSWVNRNSLPQSKVLAIRLVDFCYSRRDEKEIEFFNAKNRYIISQKKFLDIPGNPIAYWVSDNFIEAFKNGKELNQVTTVFEGLKSRDKQRFLRLWYEVSSDKWKPYAKGGSFRRWYGNNEYVLNWENDGEAVRNFKKSSGANFKNYFIPTVTYSALTSYKFSGRYLNKSLFGGGGGGITNYDQINYILAFVNSNVFSYILKAISPTLNFEVGQIGKIPLIVNEYQKNEVEAIAQQNTLISKTDWDSFEISWDFVRNPLLVYKDNTIKESISKWVNFTEQQFKQLKSNEQRLNEIFIQTYGLENELSPEVDDKDITITTNPKYRYKSIETIGNKFIMDTIKEFISYSIGCILGRYSLDNEGLVFTGKDFGSKYNQSFISDKNNILPILPGAYFEDDIVSKFIEFVQATFGEKTLYENLDFIADTIGKKKGETPKETIRRYFLNDFYKGHLQTYKKRPIYWLFTSGKQKAFNCLIYMHRYDKTTLSRIRTDYLHEFQIRLDAEKKDLLVIVEGDYSTKEISNAKKELKTLEMKIEELKEYDEVLHHMADMQIEIDLDDGVIVNYEKFKGLVAKI